MLEGNALNCEIYLIICLFVVLRKHSKKITTECLTSVTLITIRSTPLPRNYRFARGVFKRMKHINYKVTIFIVSKTTITTVKAEVKKLKIEYASIMDTSTQSTVSKTKTCLAVISTVELVENIGGARIR